jgi:hypothetical protein
MGWISPAVQAIEGLCKRRRPDVLWASAGPVSSFHVAEKASRRTGIPYVLDFRDAWTITFNEFEERQPSWARQLQRRNMFRFLKGAQAIIFRYEREAECYWRAYPGALKPSKVWTIPNGFDGEVEPFVENKRPKCEILYTGTLSDYRYDTLLEAVRQLKQTFPNEAAQLDLHFVGEGTDAIAIKARDLGINEIITVEGPVAHDALGPLSKNADALLLLGRPPSMRGYELFAAAKLFGYLKEGRPIVGVLPPDEAKSILKTLGVLTVADVDSVAGVMAVLRHVLHSWAGGTLASLVPDVDGCRAFAADRQSEILARALNGDAAADCFLPGRAEIPESLRNEISCREKLTAVKSSDVVTELTPGLHRPDRKASIPGPPSQENLH